MMKLRAYCLRLLPVIITLFLIGCGGEGKKAANPNVVATYAHGEITAEILENYLKQRTEGFKVIVGDSLVPVIDRIPKTVEVYSGIIREMVLDDMVKRKIKEKQLDNRNNIRHVLKHTEDQITLQELHSEIHERNKIPVSEIEIQQYYDKNRSQFGDKPLYDVREEIKGILVSEKEPAYVAKYISEAESYRNSLIPPAKGEAERLMREAEGYQASTVNQAQGDTERFLQMLAEYQKKEGNPSSDITLTRLYLETMEKILPKVKKYILNSAKGGKMNLCFFENARD
jgi:hypothetical protein